MDQSTGSLKTDDNSENGGPRRSIEDIERDIHRTQSEMSRTINSIQYRLSPEFMKARARKQMRDTSRGMMGKIKDNPAAAAVAGIGLYMLLRGSDSTASDDDYEYVMICDACEIPVYEHMGQEHGFTERPRGHASQAGSSARGKAEALRDRASDAAHQVGEKASDAAERLHDSADRMGERARMASVRARQKTRSAGRKAQRKFDQDPLLMGAIGIAAGALLGALVPETDKERELMGEARDDVMRRSKRLAREKGEQVRRVAEHATDAVVEQAKQESRRQNLTSETDDRQLEPSRGTPTI